MLEKKKKSRKIEPQSKKTKNKKRTYVIKLTYDYPKNLYITVGENGVGGSQNSLV